MSNTTPGPPSWENQGSQGGYGSPSQPPRGSTNPYRPEDLQGDGSGSGDGGSGGYGSGPYDPYGNGGGRPPRKKWKTILPIVLGVLVLVAAIAVIALVLFNRDDDTNDDEAGGGDSSATSEGSDAITEEDFCDTFTQYADYDPADEDNDETPSEAADALEETGLPDSASDEVQAGFEEYVAALRDTEGKSEDEIDELGEDLADSDDVAALGDYYTETCLEGGASGSPDSSDSTDGDDDGDDGTEETTAPDESGDTSGPGIGSEIGGDDG